MTDTARLARRRQPARTGEITEPKPPGTWTVHGGGGPLTATATTTIEPLDPGQRSRVTIALAFRAHRTGRLPFRSSSARRHGKQLPGNQQRLSELLKQET
jgi:hypothetical protein